MAPKNMIEAGDDDSALDELKPGTKLLHGQYTISRYLNSGGFGITYLAKDSLDRVVVIKECYAAAFCRRTNDVVSARSRAHQDDLKSIIRHFIKEAQSLSKLVHPNIVGVHQVFEDNDTAYMAIDYIEGQDLLDILEDPNQKLGQQQIVDMTRKLLVAVGFIHNHHLLHRDISPDNIVLDMSGEPILIDFGAARENISMSPKKHSALRVVKDGYSPQEFYTSGSDQGPWSDLYALAASLYHAITDAPPISGQHRLVAIAEQRPDPYEPLTGNVAGYPDGFLEAIDKALITIPAERVQSAQEWLHMLDNPAAGTGTIDSTKPAQNRTSNAAIDNAIQVGVTQSSARNKMLMAGSVLAMIAVVGFFGYSKYSTEQALSAAERAEAARTVAAAEAAQIAATQAARLAANSEAEAARLVLEANNARLIAEAEVARIAMQAEQEVTRVAVEYEALRVAVEEEAAAEVEAARVAAAEDAARVAQEVEAGRRAAEAEAVRQAQEAKAAIASQVMYLTHTPLPFGVSLQGATKITTTGASAPSWVKTGQKIVTVNGMPVQSVGQIQRAIAETAPILEESRVVVEFGVEDQNTEITTSHSLEIPVVVEVALRNGLRFQSREKDGAWITRVMASPSSSSDGLNKDDVIVAYVATNEQINDRGSLLNVLKREVQKGTEDFNFAVKRDGKFWLVSMHNPSVTMN